MTVDPDSLKDRSRNVKQASQTIGDNVSDDLLEAANPDEYDGNNDLDDPRSKLERIRNAKDD